MKAELAIHLSECLKEVDGIDIEWRVIKKYADDFEEEGICGYCGNTKCECRYDENGMLKGE